MCAQSYFIESKLWTNEVLISSLWYQCRCQTISDFSLGMCWLQQTIFSNTNQSNLILDFIVFLYSGIHLWYWIAKTCEGTLYVYILYIYVFLWYKKIYKRFDLTIYDFCYFCIMLQKISLCTSSIGRRAALIKHGEPMKMFWDGGGGVGIKYISMLCSKVNIFQISKGYGMDKINTITILHRLTFYNMNKMFSVKMMYKFFE